jgi:hypothetical protein
MSERSLAEQIATEPKRPTVIDDCVNLVDEEVRGKGLMIKAAYGTVKKIKPGFVKGAVDGLLDGWCEKLETFYAKWRSDGSGSFADYVTVRKSDVADALLQVTDERAATSEHKTAAKLYKKLRPSALKNVEAAVPKLGAVVEKHLDS